MLYLFIPPKSQACSIAWKNIKLEFLYLNLKSRNSYKNRESYMLVHRSVHLSLPPPWLKGLDLTFLILVEDILFVKPCVASCLSGKLLLIGYITLNTMIPDTLAIHHKILSLLILPPLLACCNPKLWPDNLFLWTKWDK